jgi:hypothetical protein
MRHRSSDTANEPAGFQVGFHDSGRRNGGHGNDQYKTGSQDIVLKSTLARELRC